MRYGMILGFISAVVVVALTNQHSPPDFQVGQKWSAGGDTTMQIVASSGDRLTIDSFQCQYRLNDVCERREHVFVSQTKKEWADMLKAWKFIEVKQ
jgi:hypothetical protein